jgi:predicted DsbA family dithiol-disulfide isomerase
LDYTELARELGLEPEQFVRDMASEAVKARVAEDIALAKKLEVKATPAVYLWGRKVEKYMLNNAEFVERINERFVKVRNNKLAREKWKQMTPKQRAALIEAAKKKKAEPSPEPQADESSGE